MWRLWQQNLVTGNGGLMNWGRGDPKLGPLYLNAKLSLRLQK